MLRDSTNLVSRTSGQNTVWIQKNRTGIKTLKKTASKLNVDINKMVGQQTALDTKVDGIQTKVDEVDGWS